MKTKLFDKAGNVKKDIEMPENFSNGIRKDILAKVFEAMKGSEMQPKGSKVGAGAGYSASGIVRHRRHAWKSAYGKGISRIPRKIMSRHGASFNWVGATVASTRGGRRAHPPKSWENLFRKINKKELKIAFDSGFAGTIDGKSLEKKYNKKIESGFVFDASVLDLKSKDFFALIEKVFGKDLMENILKNKKQRAGKGKLRGRKYKSNAGLLFVVASDEEMRRGGIDVVKVNELKIKDLAPNGEAGRITGYTEKAIDEIKLKFGEKNE